MDPIVTTAISLVVAAVAGTLIVRLRTKNARREAFLALAHAHGWVYRETDDKLNGRWDVTWYGRTRFAAGRPRDVLTGLARKRDFTLYTSILDGDLKGEFSVALVHLPVIFPPAAVVPHDQAALLGPLLGLPAVETGLDLEDTYEVRGEDAEFARGLFSGELAAWLTRPGKERHVFAVAGADAFTVAAGGLERREVDDKVGLISRFADLIGADVTAAHGTPAPKPPRRGRRRT
jgi:hypothetical protein